MRHLGLDSLELVSVASALNETLHLYESGVEDLLLIRRTVGDWVSVVTQGLEHFSEQITFRTSGSSGHSKPCTHELTHLKQEVQYLGLLVADRSRILTAVPAHHIYGFLFTVLLPNWLACGPVIDVRGVIPQALQKFLQSGDLLVSHPTHWNLVARYASILPTQVHGVSSTAICPDEVAQMLVGIRLERLLQVYGSSETAGIGWRDAPVSAYELMPHWKRDKNDDSVLARTGPDGSISLFKMLDQIDWQGKKNFHIGGRIDAAVKIGGINVFPDRVRQIILTHPNVQDAAVRLMAAHEGQRLKAYIVLNIDADPSLLREELTRWVLNRLSTAEQPKSFSFGNKLPVNENGKACDWSID